jgi:membrane protease YdiL (CAAX protease family)
VEGSPPSTGPGELEAAHRSAREFLVVVATAVVGLVGAHWYRSTYPGPDLASRLLGPALFFLWLPLLSTLLLMPSHPAAFGMLPGNRRSTPYALGAFALGLVLLPLALLPFLHTLQHLPSAAPFLPHHGASWVHLLGIQLVFAFPLFCEEWFFRGFLLFGLWRGVRALSLVLQALLFLLYQWPVPGLESIAALPAGLVLGFVSWRCQSFVPGFLARWGLLTLLDCAAALLRHSL